MDLQQVAERKLSRSCISSNYVLTIYQGAPPEDVENLITKEIEKEIKSINGVKKITSNSVQNSSSVIIEFETDIDVTEAKRDVQDAVNRANRIASRFGGGS